MIPSVAWVNKQLASSVADPRYLNYLKCRWSRKAYCKSTTFVDVAEGTMARRLLGYDVPVHLKAHPPP